MIKLILLHMWTCLLGTVTSGGTWCHVHTSQHNARANRLRTSACNSGSAVSLRSTSPRNSLKILLFSGFVYVKLTTSNAVFRVSAACFLASPRQRRLVHYGVMASTRALKPRFTPNIDRAPSVQVSTHCSQLTPFSAMFRSLKAKNIFCNRNSEVLDTCNSASA
jgi:hypothetical protein